MMTTKLVFSLLGLFSGSSIADFAIGGYAGEQLAGTWGQPGQLAIRGTFISTNIPGQEDGFETADFCDAGTSADASQDEW